MFGMHLGFYIPGAFFAEVSMVFVLFGPEHGEL
jgi:hypothetical protein